MDPRTRWPGRPGPGPFGRPGSCRHRPALPCRSTSTHRRTPGKLPWRGPAKQQMDRAETPLQERAWCWWVRAPGRSPRPFTRCRGRHRPSARPRTAPELVLAVPLERKQRLGQLFAVDAGSHHRKQHRPSDIHQGRRSAFSPERVTAVRRRTRRSHGTHSARSSAPQQTQSTGTASARSSAAAPAQLVGCTAGSALPWSARCLAGRSGGRAEVRVEPDRCRGHRRIRGCCSHLSSSAVPRCRAVDRPHVDTARGHRSPPVDKPAQSSGSAGK